MGRGNKNKKRKGHWEKKQKGNNEPSKKVHYEEEDHRTFIFRNKCFEAFYRVRGRFGYEKLEEKKITLLKKK